jgi:hypothetical protein
MKKKQNIIEIQKEVKIEQSDEVITLEKGDKIQILKEGRYTDIAWLLTDLFIKNSKNNAIAELDNTELPNIIAESRNMELVMKEFLKVLEKYMH